MTRTPCPEILAISTLIGRDRKSTESYRDVRLGRAAAGTPVGIRLPGRMGTYAGGKLRLCRSAVRD